jgi:hypothetical protein
LFLLLQLLLQLLHLVPLVDAANEINEARMSPMASDLDAVPRRLFRFFIFVDVDFATTFVSVVVIVCERSGRATKASSFVSGIRLNEANGGSWAASWQRRKSAVVTRRRRTATADG